MNTQEIKTLPPGEKLKLMEALWEDMRERYESSPVPPEVIALLRHRQEKVRRGEAKLLDWDQVKFAIGRG